MENCYLLSTGNDGYRHTYEFKKEASFQNLFLRFMEELGFDEKDLFYFKNTYESAEGGEDVLVPRDITESKDYIENYRKGEFDVDIIYFEKTVVMIVRTKHHKKLSELANKYFRFIGES